MDAFPQPFSGDPAEEREHTDMACPDPGHGVEEHNYQQDGSNAQSDKANNDAAVRIHHSSPRTVENCHGSSLPLGDSRPEKQAG